MPLKTQHDRLVTYFDNLLTIKSHDAFLRDHVINKNHYISTVTVPLVTKLSRMVTNLEGLLLIKVYDHITRRYCDII